MRVPVLIRFEPDALEAIDKARGDQSRNRFVSEAAAHVAVLRNTPMTMPRDPVGSRLKARG